MKEQNEQQLREKLARLEDEIQSRDTAKEAMESELRRAAAEMEELKYVKRQLEDRNKELEDQLRAACSERIQEMENKVHQLKTELIRVVEENKNLSQQLSESQKVTTQIAEQLAAVKTESEAALATTTSNAKRQRMELTRLEQRLQEIAEMLNWKRELGRETMMRQLMELSAQSAEIKQLLITTEERQSKENKTSGKF